MQSWYDPMQSLYCDLESPHCVGWCGCDSDYNHDIACSLQFEIMEVIHKPQLVKTIKSQLGQALWILSW